MKLLVIIYLAAIVAANISVAHFGPQSSIITAMLFIGLDLTTRDRLHDAWGHGWPLRARMAALIIAGGALSFAFSTGTARIAIASSVAFAAAAVADAIVYHMLRRREWFERANGSNFAGSAVDSLIFPTIAFGSLLPYIIIGQFAAKVCGGLAWSIVLRRRLSR